MLVTPIVNPKDFPRTHNLNDYEAGTLLAIAKKGGPEVLAFMRDVDVEQMTVQGTELCSHILYYNLRQLFKLPSLGAVDQKRKYCSAYAASDTMRQFFKGQSVKMLTFRLVAEAILLYGLEAGHLRMLSRWCCTFTREEDPELMLDYASLTNIYNKKALGKLLQECIDPDAAQLFPPRIMKGMEYPSCADFIHVFRSVGQDPYEMFCTFAHRNAAKLGPFGNEGLMINAFELIPLDEPVAAPQPAQEPAEPAQVSQPIVEDLEPVEAAQPAMEEIKPAVEPDEPEPIVEEVEPEPAAPTIAEAVEPPLVEPVDPEAEFFRAVQNAIRPMNSPRPSRLVENIRLLRSGSSGVQNTASFDALFISSHYSNLDIFNYLVRTSLSYGVPMYALFYHILNLKKYPPRKEYEVREYTIAEIEQTINDYAWSAAPISNLADENLFDTLAMHPSVFLRPFGEPWTNTFQKTLSQPLVGSNSWEKDPPPTAPSQPMITPNPDPAPEPDAEAAKPNKKESSAMTAKLKIRVCRPCDADSWENDNPDKSAPGFYWENANAEEQTAAQSCADAILTGDSFDVALIRAKLAEIIQMPFKARLVATGEGFKANIDLF